ncbi:related to amino-terminal amidase [Phialocephala subalpina]|uniref:Related to amino-terminal amidase n=1 Tax=Phialocephala subalpina TaxID=576137 RepID=A0A1L7X2J1_9HELO|nr:related to amino-terminal amidase [Phialocephala subalpina]
MRIACLQFAPQVGDVNNNLNRADSVLSRANPKNLDLLVLPELAFSGYNFRSLQHVSPFLEPTAAGITSLWARTTALKYNCHVIAGYPEKVDVSPKWPASPEYYNSAITVNPEGETIANYRKSFLYYTDETWALEGPDGFYDGVIEGLGNVAMGICKWPTKSFERMDLNPYKFEAPWSAWEFANHVLHREANLVILSMAWLTRENPRSYSRVPKEPDMDTLSYWLSRLEPLIREEGEEEIICVFANRCGTEDEATYAGTSAVLGIQGGEVKVYGILGRGEKELLVIDTSKRAQMQLVSEPRAPTTKMPVKSPMRSPADIRSSTSSSSTIDSGRSLSSELSISTGHTSADPPPLEPVSFSPISPVENPSKQSFFGPGPVQDHPPPRPESRAAKERRPTPIPQSSPVPDPTPELQSILGSNRYPTPIPHSRPPSPKSRNASRSRGPNLIDSPLLDEILPNEILHSEVLPEDIRTTRAQFSNNRITQSVSVDATEHLPRISPAAEPEAKLTRPTRATSENSSQYESSFTKNTLGPRSRHISPRPRSTLW